MSSSDRRTLLCLLAGLPLAACGFSPVYAPGGPAAALRGRIRVDAPTDRNGFDFVERLEERLGRPQAPIYDLSYTIKTNQISVGITPDNDITRYNLTGRVDWSVTDRTSGARVAGGTAESFTSFSATGSTVAGLAAEEDAGLRLMRTLADQIVTQITATAPGWAG